MLPKSEVIFIDLYREKMLFYISGGLSLQFLEYVTPGCVWCIPVCGVSWEDNVRQLCMRIFVCI